MTSPPGPWAPIRFGPFDLDAVSGELRKAGIRLKLHPQPIRVLVLLATRPGQVVTREEIQECLWGRDTYVDFERGINFCVSQIRAALGDDPEKPRYIETLPRRGYRFVGQIASHHPAQPTAPSTASSAAPGLAAGNAGDGINTAPRMDSVSSIGKGPASLARRRLSAIAAALALAVLAGALLWPTKRRPSSSPADFKLRQLTANSVENPVRSGAISPDGEYLAYADLKEMHIKLVKTGEVRSVPQPEGLKESRVYWEIVGWFPDGTSFLANATVPPEYSTSSYVRRPSIWAVELLGGSPRKLRDNAEAWSVSPDGSLIAFGTGMGRFGDRQVWLMGPNGENPRKLYGTDEASGFGRFRWFPGGQRIAYVRSDKSGDTLLSRDLRGGSPATILSSSQMQKVPDYLLLPDGRMIYALQERQSSNTCNYWEIQIDPRTAQPVGRPRQVTRWAGFCLDKASVTADGKKLAFVEWAFHSSAFVADLEANGTRVTRPRRFTFNESWDYPADWTADSRAVILLSNRDGHFGVYRQLLDGGTAQPLVTGPRDAENPHVSPDGAWLLYTIQTNEQGSPATRIMRVPITGGPPQVVAAALAAAQLLCTRAPANFCVIEEHTADRTQVMFTALDPLKGRDRELLRAQLDPNRNYLGWDISPDGTRIVLHKFPEGPYDIVSLRGKAAQRVTVNGWSTLRGCDWAADSKGLFVSAPKSEGSVLLHIDLHGNSHVLWEQPVGSVTYARPSPDGRHLAMQGWTLNGNMWMLEGF